MYCDCGYAASDEVGEGLARPTVYDVPEMEKVATPGVHTIAELAEFLGIPESSTVKALSGKNDEGKLVVLFVPGDHEVNEEKAARVAGGFTILTDEDMESYGLHKGSMGPVGLPEDAFVIAANSLKAVPKWVVGANEDGYHYVGAQLGKDFKVDQWADIITVKPGDCCPKCGMELKGARGIEVAQVFQLGDKYSRAMNATFMNKDGKEQPFIMGCYGVGVSRTLAAIIEQHNDENGMIWPMSVAPAHVCILPLATGDDLVQPAAEKLAERAGGPGPGSGHRRPQGARGREVRRGRPDGLAAADRHGQARPCRGQGRDQAPRHRRAPRHLAGGALRGADFRQGRAASLGQ